MRAAHSSNSHIGIAREESFGANVKEVTTITCVADVNKSLQNKYGFISSPTVSHYFWINVNSEGSDPTIAGRTAHEIAVATGATASTIATALAASLDASSDLVATADGAIVTVTAFAAGYALAQPGDAGFTGFTIAIATPWTFLEYGSEDIKLVPRKVDSAAIINSRVKKDKYIEAWDPNGGINNVEINPDNIGLFLAALCGTEATPVLSNTAVYTHSFTPATISPLDSLAIQTVRDIVGMRTTGMKINEATLSAKIHSILQGSLKFIGKDGNETIGGRSAQKTTIVCTGDVGPGSLNNRYFFLNTPTTEYYVWYDVAFAGVDPAIPGKTGIHVVLTGSAVAADVAAAVQAALAALTTKFYASVTSATVTVINAELGAVEAPSNAGAAGVTLTVTTAGTNVTPSYSSRLPYTFTQGAVSIDPTEGDTPVAVYYVKGLDVTINNDMDADGWVMNGSTLRYSINIGDLTVKFKFTLEPTRAALALRTAHTANYDMSASVVFTSTETIPSSDPATKYSFTLTFPHIKLDDADMNVGGKGQLPFEANGEIISSATPFTLALADARSTKWSA